jgi:hypothetical protein
VFVPDSYPVAPERVHFGWRYTQDVSHPPKRRSGTGAGAQQLEDRSVSALFEHHRAQRRRSIVADVETPLPGRRVRQYGVERDLGVQGEISGEPWEQIGKTQAR